MKGLITMIDSILKIIEHQYPKDFFTSITKEIALSLREKFGIDSFIFIFENERNILTLQKTRPATISSTQLWTFSNSRKLSRILSL